MKKSYNVPLYLSGIFITFLGNSAFNFVLSWWLVKETGDASLLGLITTISFVPVIILNIISGGLVDKWNKKKVLVISDVIAGIGCLIGFIFLKESLSIFILSMVVILLKTTNVFFSIGSRSIVKNITSEEQFLFLNKSQTLIRQSLDLIVPLAGAVLIHLIAPYYFLLINGVSFIFSGILESRLVYEENKSIQRTKVDFLGGFKYVWEDKKLFFSILLASVANFFIAGLNIAIPYISVGILENDYLYSYIMSAQAIGAIAAPLLLNFLSKNKKEKTGENYYVYLIIISFALFACFPFPPVMILSVFIHGFCASMFNIAFFTYVQIHAQEENMGKVMGIIYTSANLLMPIGTSVFAFMSAFTQQWTIMVIGGLFVIALSGVFIIKKQVSKQKQVKL